MLRRVQSIVIQAISINGTILIITFTLCDFVCCTLSLSLYVSACVIVYAGKSSTTQREREGEREGLPVCDLETKGERERKPY